MEKSYIWGIIVLTGVVTYIPRLMPFLLLSKKAMPDWFKIWLSYVPTCIFGSMIFSEIFVRENGVNLSFNNIYLLSSILVFAISIKTKSLGATIAAGFIIFWLLQKQSFLQMSF